VAPRPARTEHPPPWWKVVAPEPWPPSEARSLAATGPGDIAVRHHPWAGCVARMGAAPSAAPRPLAPDQPVPAAGAAPRSSPLRPPRQADPTRLTPARDPAPFPADVRFRHWRDIGKFTKGSRQAATAACAVLVGPRPNGSRQAISERRGHHLEPHRLGVRQPHLVPHTVLADVPDPVLAQLRPGQARRYAQRRRHADHSSASTARFPAATRKVIMTSARSLAT
jgi:hypothetical protein